MVMLMIGLWEGPVGLGIELPRYETNPIEPDDEPNHEEIKRRDQKSQGGNSDDAQRLLRCFVSSRILCPYLNSGGSPLSIYVTLRSSPSERRGRGWGWRRAAAIHLGRKGPAPPPAPLASGACTFDSLVFRPPDSCYGRCCSFSPPLLFLSPSVRFEKARVLL